MNSDFWGRFSFQNPSSIFERFRVKYLFGFLAAQIPMFGGPHFPYARNPQNKSPFFRVAASPKFPNALSELRPGYIFRKCVGQFLTETPAGAKTLPERFGMELPSAGKLGAITYLGSHRASPTLLVNSPKSCFLSSRPSPK